MCMQKDPNGTMSIQQTPQLAQVQNSIGQALQRGAAGYMAKTQSMPQGPGMIPAVPPNGVGMSNNGPTGMPKTVGGPPQIGQIAQGLVPPGAPPPGGMPPPGTSPPQGPTPGQPPRPPMLPPGMQHPGMAPGPMMAPSGHPAMPMPGAMPMGPRGPMIPGAQHAMQMAPGSVQPPAGAVSRLMAGQPHPAGRGIAPGR